MRIRDGVEGSREGGLLRVCRVGWRMVRRPPSGVIVGAAVFFLLIAFGVSMIWLTTKRSRLGTCVCLSGRKG